MMMKLMKFLVVALAVGGVCAPVLSQAGEVDGKAVMCKFSLGIQGGMPYINEDKAEGKHLAAFHFGSGLVFKIVISVSSRPRVADRNSPGRKYRATDTKIEWVNLGRQYYRLNRKTLHLKSIGGRVARHGKCELIDPIQIDAGDRSYLPA